MKTDTETHTFFIVFNVRHILKDILHETQYCKCIHL